jgi:hypothetical protein
VSFMELLEAASWLAETDLGWSYLYYGMSLACRKRACGAAESRSAHARPYDR